MHCPACRAEITAAAPFCAACGARAPLSPGTLLDGRYEVVRFLGAGGMGDIYLAQDRTLGGQVALKILRGGGGELEERFRQEIRLAREVTHPNVCRIHEYREADGLRFISMAFIDGVDLRRFLKTAPPGLPHAFAIGIAVAEGLHAVHDAGIVHRDLKSSNVMVDRRGVARLLDFGIARGAGSTALTQTGQMLGTPEYMSPEQVRGVGVDARSDIYSLGVLLYELFAGRLPFEADTPMALGLKHLQEPPDLARLPAALVPVVRQALSKDPSDRQATAADVAVQLRAAAAGLGVTPALAKPVFDAVEPLSPPPPDPMPTNPLATLPTIPPVEKPAARPRRREPRVGLWLGVGLTLVTAAIVVVGLIGGLISGPPPHPHIGATSRVLQDADRRRLDLPAFEGGVVLDSLLPGAPAQQAGLRVDDVVLRVDGRRIDRPDSLEQLVLEGSIGQSIEVEFLRAGSSRPRTVRVQIADAEADAR